MGGRKVLSRLSSLSLSVHFSPSTTFSFFSLSFAGWGNIQTNSHLLRLLPLPFFGFFLPPLSPIFCEPISPKQHFFFFYPKMHCFFAQGRVDLTLLEEGRQIAKKRGGVFFSWLIHLAGQPPSLLLSLSLLPDLPCSPLSKRCTPRIGSDFQIGDKDDSCGLNGFVIANRHIAEKKFSSGPEKKESC